MCVASGRAPDAGALTTSWILAPGPQVRALRASIHARSTATRQVVAPGGPKQVGRAGMHHPSRTETPMIPSNTLRRAAIAASLTLLAACQDIPSPTSPDVRAARSQQAQDRLEVLFQKASPEVMALPGTVFADNDEVAGRLVFGIEHMGAARAVENALARLGIAKDDYSVELTQPIHLAATLRDRFRPTQAGIQIHFTQYLCTMGFNVTHESGERSFITNSHCTATQGGTEGTVYYQPTSTTDPTVIATEVNDPTYFKGGECPRGKKCRYSDASRARYSSAVASIQGDILKTTSVNTGSLTVGGVFAITAQNDRDTSFPVGTVVNKVGRTTGWTRGAVTRTCTNTSVQGSQIMQLCQSFVSDAGGAVVVGSGDSGSPVFRDTGGDQVELVGILWGGSSDNKQFVFSPLRSIERELGQVVATK